MFAFFCLPRQFHIGVVECADVADVRRARWWFGGYLVLLSIVVIPIVAASLPLDAAGRSAPSTDALVLWIPLRPARSGSRCSRISAASPRPPAWSSWRASRCRP